MINYLIWLGIATLTGAIVLGFALLIYVTVVTIKDMNNKN